MDLFGYRQLTEQIKALANVVEAVCYRLKRLENGMGVLQEKIDALRIEVAELATVVDSAVTLIKGLADLIRESKDAPDQLAALAADLDAKAAVLAAAVQANTPSQ